MAKLLFLPLSIATGLLAGLLSKKTFELIWTLIDDQEAPKPEHRHAPLGKLALALTFEGALFRLVKGFVDHTSRRGFNSLTGTWPGDEQPEAK
jgi:Protein of unknown function (DUF4235)